MNWQSVFATFLVFFLYSDCEGTKLNKDSFNHINRLSAHIKPPPHIHGKFAYVTWSKEKGYDIKIFGVQSELESSNDYGLDWVAKGRYQNLVNKTGWAILEIETKPEYEDEQQMYAAGMAEGYLTRDLIYYFWKNVLENYCEGKETVCKYIEKFTKQNQDWVDKSISKLQDSSPYWGQVRNVYQQLEGLIYGYQKAANGTYFDVLKPSDFFMINILGDLGDLESALNPDPSKKTVDDGHCSVLVKLIGDRDIYASHVTWWRYTSMLRVMKRYELHVKSSSNKAVVPGNSISMSSYPGMIWSMDDFYTVSSGLLVTETSLSVFNNDLWKKVTPQNMLFTGVRVMVANRLAVDGRDWVKLFTLFNSGTYNNQWMIVNYNAFEPEKPLKDGVLTVVEQLPGLIVSRDVTPVLKKNGYWASYNSPFFADVFDLSGAGKMQKKFGDYYSYSNSPRARIFARDQGKVQDIDSMMALMRYNDYVNDPLAKCDCNPPYSAINAISSRCDLNPENGTYPFPALGFRPIGATDMKLTNLDLFTLQQFVGISGPTFSDTIPPFRWSTSPLANESHYGMPDKFEFEALIHHWHWL